MGQSASPVTVDAYDYGDLPQFQATFVGTDGITPRDPSTIDFLLANAVGSVATYRFGEAGASIVRSGTGAYFTDRTISGSGGYGHWYYRWIATGGVQAAHEHQLLVRRSFIL